MIMMMMMMMMMMLMARETVYLWVTTRHVREYMQLRYSVET